MSSLALFALGAGVSFIVFAALALLVTGAVLDGVDERKRREQLRLGDSLTGDGVFALPASVARNADMSRVIHPVQEGDAA